MVNKQIALVDDRAILEVDLVEIAADAGPDRHFVDRLEPPDELVVLDDFAHDGLGNRDDGEILLRGRLPVEKHASQQSGQQDSARNPDPVPETGRTGPNPIARPIHGVSSRLLLSARQFTLT